MKKVSICVLIVLAFSATVSAQSTDSDSRRPFELSWNPYSYMRQSGENTHGGAFALGYRKSDRLGYVLDLSIHQSKNTNVVFTAYRFGPRLYFRERGRFAPFAEVLAGGAYLGTQVTVNGTTTTSIPSKAGISFATGGGLNMQLRPWFSWRVFQVDYSLIHGRGETLNGVRIQTGGVFHFGPGQ